MAEIQKVGVVGCGLMGSGIAQICAQNGYPVTVCEVNMELANKGLDRIRKFLEEGIKKGKVTRDQLESTMKNLKATTKFEDFEDCDIVIEAVTENMATKKETFRTLDRVCKPSTIFASNTSSLSITAMGAVTKRPGNCIGMHFFNPVPIMKLVEIVRPEITSEETYQTVMAFASKLGKKVVTAKDTPGFIVNYLLVPFLLDAVRMVEQGIATKEDVDTAVELGLNHPMGPLKLLDFVGLDTTLFIADAMFEEFKSERYAAPPLLRRMVNAGWNGRKAGRGFYVYNK